MALKVAANQAQYLFITQNLSDSSFIIIDFSGKDSISSPYEFKITLISHNQSINPDDILGEPATFYMFRNDMFYPYSGIVKEFEFLESTIDYCTYQATLVPKLWTTSLNFRTRIFQNQTVTDIIQSVLQESSVTNFNLSVGTYPSQEFVVQYQETDLNFISRLMEGAGIWYYFEEPTLSVDDVAPGASQEKLMITDSPQFTDIAAPAQIRFRAGNALQEGDNNEEFESIGTVQYSKKLIPSEAVVKTYNHRSPEVNLLGRQPLQTGDSGTYYEYGGSYRTIDDAQTAATVLSKRLSTQQMKIGGSGDCRGFKAGYRFELQEHAHTNLCVPYVITSVEHGGGKAPKKYQNSFKAIPNDQAQNYAPEKSTNIPKVNGILTAQIEANGSPYASLDDKGYYKIRLPYDLSTNKNDCTGSKYIRLAQPYSGAQYGFHFPSHEGTEMIVACVNGDPDKPLGIGTIPNANTMSPVVATNKHENVIKTAGNNSLIMDDTDGKQKIKLVTNNKHGLEMDDENKRIVITSTDLNQLLLDDDNSKVVIKSDTHTVSMSYGDSKYIEILSGEGHLIKIDDSNKIISVKTNGGHQIDMDDQGKKIILADGQGKSSVTLDGNKGLILDSTGKISINATQDIEISGANIKISSSQGKIDLKATTDLSISGININQKGTAAVKIEGLQFEAKGTASVKVQGATAEFKGDMSAKLSGGAMAEVSGGAMTTIKGGIVMIN